MNRSIVITGISVFLSMPIVSSAQVAGSTLLGVASAEMREVTSVGAPSARFSASPYTTTRMNVIGKIDDIIIAPGQGSLLRHHRRRRLLRGRSSRCRHPGLADQIARQKARLTRSKQKGPGKRQPNFEYAPRSGGK